jgi:citrate lyase gamma subunit
MREKTITLHNIELKMEVACTRQYVNKIISRVISVLNKLNIATIKIVHTEDITIETPSDAENFIDQ